MRYVGIDVHSKASVWSLLDQDGVQLGEGKVPTTVPALARLMSKLGGEGDLVVGQEVGSMATLVHDAVTGAGVKLLSFNPYHLRMIASSRKKTDRRDAYWLAKALQTGMTPHPVYIPTGHIRELRELLARRRMVQRDRNRWQYRARAYLRLTGLTVRTGGHYLRRVLDKLTECPDGIETRLLEGLGLCHRQQMILGEELEHIEGQLQMKTDGIEEVERLMTIPGVGHIAATTLYAWVGDIGRFPNSKALCAYAGLVPSVRQSGDSNRLGGITKQGAPALRGVLVQAAHVLQSRCRSEGARPLQAIYDRIRGTRGRRKVAIVALARHILRVAFHILRDGSKYDASRLTMPQS